MSLSLLTKLAMAGVVLTGVTGTAALGNVTGVNHEVKAEENHPNAKYFHKNVDGKDLDFTDTFKKDKLSPKTLNEEVKNKLTENGLSPDKYRLKLKVKLLDGSTLESPSGGAKIVGNEYINTQTAEFNPNKQTLDEFDIVSAQ